MKNISITFVRPPEHLDWQEKTANSCLHFWRLAKGRSVEVKSDGNFLELTNQVGRIKKTAALVFTYTVGAIPALIGVIILAFSDSHRRVYEAYCKYNSFPATPEAYAAKLKQLPDPSATILEGLKRIAYRNLFKVTDAGTWNNDICSSLMKVLEQHPDYLPLLGKLSTSPLLGRLPPFCTSRVQLHALCNAVKEDAGKLQAVVCGSLPTVDETPLHKKLETDHVRGFRQMIGSLSSGQFITLIQGAANDLILPLTLFCPEQFENLFEATRQDLMKFRAVLTGCLRAERHSNTEHFFKNVPETELMQLMPWPSLRWEAVLDIYDYSQVHNFKNLEKMCIEQMGKFFTEHGKPHIPFPETLERMILLAKPKVFSMACEAIRYSPGGSAANYPLAILKAVSQLPSLSKESCSNLWYGLVWLKGLEKWKIEKDEAKTLSSFNLQFQPEDMSNVLAFFGNWQSFDLSEFLIKLPAKCLQTLKKEEYLGAICKIPDEEQRRRVLSDFLDDLPFKQWPSFPSLKDPQVLKEVVIIFEKKEIGRRFELMRFLLEEANNTELALEMMASMKPEQIALLFQRQPIHWDAHIKTIYAKFSKDQPFIKAMISGLNSMLLCTLILGDPEILKSLDQTTVFSILAKLEPSYLDKMLDTLSYEQWTAFIGYLQEQNLPHQQLQMHLSSIFLKGMRTFRSLAANYKKAITVMNWIEGFIEKIKIQPPKVIGAVFHELIQSMESVVKDADTTKKATAIQHNIEIYQEFIQKFSFVQRAEVEAEIQKLIWDGSSYNQIFSGIMGLRLKCWEAHDNTPFEKFIGSFYATDIGYVIKYMSEEELEKTLAKWGLPAVIQGEMIESSEVLALKNIKDAVTEEQKTKYFTGASAI